MTVYVEACGLERIRCGISLTRTPTPRKRLLDISGTMGISRSALGKLFTKTAGPGMQTRTGTPLSGRIFCRCLLGTRVVWQFEQFAVLNLRVNILACRYDDNQCPHGGEGGGHCILPDDRIWDYQLRTASVDALNFAAETYKNTSTPFFLMTGFRDPHAPWAAPQRMCVVVVGSCPAIVLTLCFESAHSVLPDRGRVGTTCTTSRQSQSPSRKYWELERL